MAMADMREPIESGCPDGFQYMHPTMRKNFGQWKYHDDPQPGVLRHVAFSGDQPHQYVVVEKLLVQEKGVPLETRIKNAQLIAPTEDERLTLVTCARPGATHRLIVIAQPKDG